MIEDALVVFGDDGLFALVATVEEGELEGEVGIIEDVCIFCP